MQWFLALLALCCFSGQSVKVARQELRSFDQLRKSIASQQEWLKRFRLQFRTTAHQSPTGPATLDDAVRLLDENRAAVMTLEGMIRDMHTELSLAEEKIVNSTETISSARQRLFALERTALNNTNRFWMFQKEVARLNSSLGMVHMKMDNIVPQLEDLKNASNTLADTASSEGNTEALNKMETVVGKIWEASDPNNPNNVDNTEERMTKIEGSMSEFEGSLDTTIRRFMVKRVRRGANLMRRALRKLGKEAHAADNRGTSTSESTIDELGSSLGLPGA
jgi:predicted  nucleic acid-binding Zn-ribbon protein